ncbi:PREDICTED: protein RRP5 homolog [Amphimedon queenslandica]|uniref:Uncharacterized protein n=1 Tax=Amphimedon queenslandica TaxID=400682 RepID=A0A1X7SGR5_AMPQE|nr:PREDICTED: protein RRP5 homolog [Amphimedon queenslandica]|eukprot:XP_011409409.2 PREDICTED: protein RRP5 homolog [Amphimedon queenslandica]
MYGDSESLDQVFKRALQQNDQFEIYTRLIDIYVTSNKPESADQLYQIMCKKFSSNIQVWSQYGRFLMEQGKADLARKILQRSFKSLTKKQHVDITKQFAQLEFKYGEMERGCTLFENLVSSYPRKVDIWSVYIDMLTKKGEMDRVRDVFERAVSLKLSSVKKQFLYKRYIEFERKHGTQSLVETVQAKSQALL